MKRTIFINGVEDTIDDTVARVLDSKMSDSQYETCAEGDKSCITDLHYCTRRKGHRGPHIAHVRPNRILLAIWDKEKP